MELTQEMIDKMKEKYGEIYKVTLNGEDFVYRPMKRVEYKQIIGSADTSRTFSEEQIVSKCLVYPEVTAADMSAQKAGTVTTLTDLIMLASNFGVEEAPVKL
jgi:hypothetical protein